MIDLEGKKFKIAANHIPPFLFLNTSFEYGVENLLLHSLKKSLNFTYELYDCGVGKKGSFGKILPNGSWDGLIGQILANQADFGISHLYVTPDRAAAVTFTSPPHLIDFATFTSPLPQFRENIVSLLEPFDTIIWIFLVFYLLSNYLLNVLLFGQKYSIFWIIISILVRQSQPVPSKTSVRVILFTWYLSAIVLTAIYGGCVFSIMTKPFEMGRIDTIEQLATAQEQNRVQVVGMDNGFYYKMLKNSKTGPCGRIGASIIAAETHIAAIDLLKYSDDNYAYVHLREQLCYSLLTNGIHKYYVPDASTISESIFATNQIALALPHGFPYVRQFNLVIQKIMQGGLMDIWSKKFYYRVFNKDMNDFGQTNHGGTEFKELNLKQFQSIFIVLLTLELASLFLLCAEYFYKITLTRL